MTVRQASSAPGHIYLYSNGEIAAHSQRADYNGYAGSIVIQARLLLEKGYKVRAPIADTLRVRELTIRGKEFKVESEVETVTRYRHPM